MNQNSMNRPTKACGCPDFEMSRRGFLGGVAAATGVMTDAKKVLGATLSTPSATPALVNERKRPFTAAMYCVGIDLSTVSA